MSEKNNGNKRVWRKRDAAYREQERQRRQANQKRREEREAAKAAGMSLEEWRRANAHDSA